MVKNLPVMQETQVQSLSWEDRLEKGMQPAPIFLPGKSHGQRSLLGYSPWGRKRVGCDLVAKQGFPSDSDSKESACNAGDPLLIPGSGRSPGEGNGYPFQYSCLENSMDRGAYPYSLKELMQKLKFQ